MTSPPLLLSTFTDIHFPLNKTNQSSRSSTPNVKTLVKLRMLYFSVNKKSHFCSATCTTAKPIVHLTGSYILGRLIMIRCTFAVSRNHVPVETVTSRISLVTLKTNVSRNKTALLLGFIIQMVNFNAWQSSSRQARLRELTSELVTRELVASELVSGQVNHVPVIYKDILLSTWYIACWYQSNLFKL